jgi:hypothetical protein
MKFCFLGAAEALRKRKTREGAEEAEGAEGKPEGGERPNSLLILLERE